MFVRKLILPLAVAACTLMPATLHAEELTIEIEAIGSGRIYADYTHGDCCDIDAFAYNETSIPVGACSTKGGYCMSGTKRASWCSSWKSVYFPSSTRTIAAREQPWRLSGNTKLLFDPLEYLPPTCCTF